MANNTQHNNSKENPTVVPFKSSFYLVLILVGLFLGAINFIQVESTGGEEHNKVEAKSMPEQMHENEAKKEKNESKAEEKNEEKHEEKMTPAEEPKHIEEAKTEIKETEKKAEKVQEEPKAVKKVMPTNAEKPAKKHRKSEMNPDYEAP